MTSFLDTAPLPAYEQVATRESIRTLRKEANAYRSGLDQEGVWLFLSTVGCWGVPDPIFQLVAFSLTGWLFGKIMRKHNTDAKSFASASDLIEKRVKAEVTDAPQREKELLELAAFRKQHVRGFMPFWLSRVFLACWVFYGFSFFAAAYKSVQHWLGAA